MAVVLVLGAKGGVGASLFAVNLALVLAREASCCLLDASPMVGGDDLLLNLELARSWRELLPVAEELEDRQVSLAAGRHESGLEVLGAPKEPIEGDLPRLVEALQGRQRWLVVDSAVSPFDQNRAICERAAVTFLVTTLDPPALRACRRLARQLADRGELALAVSQWTSSHPSNPEPVADSMGLPLAAVVPYAPTLIGEQVGFGRPAIGRNGDSYGKALATAAAYLRGLAGKVEGRQLVGSGEHG